MVNLIGESGAFFLLHVVSLRDIKILMRYIFRYLKISKLWFG